MKLPLILASQSPARARLLQQIGVNPDEIIPADIDEIERKNEKPRALAARLSAEKARAVAGNLERCIIIAADTVPVVGGRIMRKARNADDVRESMRLLSGRRHQIYTGVTVIRKDGPGEKIITKCVKTILKFRIIPDAEIEYFAQLGEGEGKAGGYTISGYADCFVSYIAGSFSNVIGLPLYETQGMLKSLGVVKHT